MSTSSWTDADLQAEGLHRATLQWVLDQNEELDAEYGVSPAGEVAPPRVATAPGFDEAMANLAQASVSVPPSWAWIRARVVNTTGTYHSYSGDPSCGLQKRGKGSYEEREHVYEHLPNGTIRWMAFKQKSLGTLSGGGMKKALPGMVTAVGGNPQDFKNCEEMAEYVLWREQPLGVLRVEDAEEAFSLDFPVNYPVHLPPPVATGWFAGTFLNGVLDFGPSTRRVCTRQTQEFAHALADIQQQE